MSYSGDHSSPDASHVFGAADLSPDDLERLATSFRPSWELDEAPFAGPASFSAADVRSLHGREASTLVRAALHSAASEPFGANKPVTAPAPPWAAPSPRPNSRPPSRGRSLPPVAPLSRPDFDVSPFAPRFKKGPWIGAGIVALALILIGVWATSSGDSGSQSPSTATAAAPEPAPLPAAHSAPASEPALAAPPPIPEVRVNALPVAPPPPGPQVVTRPSTPAWPPSHPPSPAAKAAAHQKAANPTIVRDVPF